MKKVDRELILWALEVLEMPVFVSLNDIKKQYRKLSKKYHPDLNESSSKIRDINQAYEILTNYIQNFRFTFSEEEIKRQFPESDYADKYRI